MNEFGTSGKFRYAGQCARTIPLFEVSYVLDQVESVNPASRMVPKGAEHVSERAADTHSTYPKAREVGIVNRPRDVELEPGLFELRRLAAGLLNALDRERQDVSLELHNGFSQKLAKLQFDIERLLSETAPPPQMFVRTLESLGTQVAGLAEDVRTMARRLHPSTLDDLGLAIAVRSLCHDFSCQQGLTIRFRAVSVPKAIPSDVANSLFRIVQEALRNSARHSGGSSVWVHLQGKRQGLRLLVRDKGAGFTWPTAGTRAGLGLAMMEERVRSVEGKLNISSRPGAGVTITVTVPLPVLEQSV